MISRRNVRIKIFQTIYEYKQQEENINENELQKSATKKFTDTVNLFTALNHLLFLITQYVLVHANQRASKFIPSYADLEVNTKLAQNTIINELKKNDTFSDAVKKAHVTHLFDQEFLKKCFSILLETQEYKKYTSHNLHNLNDEKEIISYIFNNLILENEHCTSYFDEHYINWEDDKDMMKLWFDKVITKPSKIDFLKLIGTEKLQFGMELLSTYFQKEDLVFTYIEPKLKNWEAERIAHIDMILIKLGVIELLFFPIIPVRVSINEYIDLAKTYSTLQSGQFVNGVLDSVHHELVAQNLIHKNNYQKK